MSRDRITLLSCLLIIILGLAIYANSLNGQFIWDDEHLVKNNVYIKSWSHLPQIFSSPLGAGAGRRYSYFHPIQVLSYTLDYSLWGLDVRGYHLSSILVHILVALSLYWLINLLYQDRLLSLLTSLLFLVHPVHTEAVSYISDRSNPLALLFMLLCLILYIKQASSKNPLMYMLALLSYSLALLSKENSLIFPGIVLAYHYCLRKKLKLSRFLPLVGLVGLYVLVRSMVLQTTLLQEVRINTVFLRIPGLFVALFNYFRLMLFPFHLHMEYGSRLFPFVHPKAILGLLISALLIVYALKKRNSNRWFCFSIFWFFIALLPMSNLCPLPFYMAEHYLYMPSAGLFIILAKGLTYLFRRKQFQILAIVSTIAILAFYACLTIKQNIYWREPLAFYQRTLKYAPDSPGIHYNLGNEYKAVNKYQQAIASFKQAIEINPNLAMVYNNLGNAYQAVNKYEEAISSFKQAVEINPNLARVYNNLGNAYQAVNKYEEAISSFKQAIEINPGYAEAYNNLGNIYQAINKYQEAIDFYKKAIEIYPDLLAAYYNLGSVYQAVNKYQEAVSSFKKVIEIDAGFARAYYSLCLIYFQGGQYELAIEYCDRARELGLVNPFLLEALAPYREQ